MKKITFKVFRSEEGGYHACAISVSIFTQAETLEELHSTIKDAIDCHHNGTVETPQIINVVFEES